MALLVFLGSHNSGQNPPANLANPKKSDLSGRMVAWSVELSKFDIQYEPRTAIKA